MPRDPAWVTQTLRQERSVRLPQRLIGLYAIWPRRVQLPSRSRDRKAEPASSVPARSCLLEAAYQESSVPTRWEVDLRLHAQHGHAGLVIDNTNSIPGAQGIPARLGAQPPSAASPAARIASTGAARPVISMTCSAAWCSSRPNPPETAAPERCAVTASGVGQG